MTNWLSFIKDIRQGINASCCVSLKVCDNGDQRDRAVVCVEVAPVSPAGAIFYEYQIVPTMQYRSGYIESVTKSIIRAVNEQVRETIAEARENA